MKYIARPVEVEAFKITKIDAAGTNDFRLELDGHEPVIATSAMTSRMTPNIGDYFVVQEDGYEYLNPKDVFERKYRPA